MGLVIAPLMILAYGIGLREGPKGVAFAYSVVMLLWLVPVAAWSVYGTVVSFWDVVLTVSRPLASSIVAGALAFGLRLAYGQLFSPASRLLLETMVLIVVYLGMLLFATGQKTLFLDLFNGLKRASSTKEGENLASV
jgi:hypothetical protein